MRWRTGKKSFDCSAETAKQRDDAQELSGFFLGQLCCSTQGFAEINGFVLGTLCLGPYLALFYCRFQPISPLYLATLDSDYLRLSCR